MVGRGGRPGSVLVHSLGPGWKGPPRGLLHPGRIVRLIGGRVSASCLCPVLCPLLFFVFRAATHSNAQNRSIVHGGRSGCSHFTARGQGWNPPVDVHLPFFRGVGKLQHLLTLRIPSVQTDQRRGTTVSALSTRKLCMTVDAGKWEVPGAISRSSAVAGPTRPRRPSASRDTRRAGRLMRTSRVQ